MCTTRKRLFTRGFTLSAALAILVGATSAQGSLIFTTPSGSTAGGNSVSGSAMFTLGSGTISILVNDLLSDPTTVGQCISSLQFTVNTATSGASMLSQTCTGATIASDGTYTTAAGSDPGWALSKPSSFTIFLNDLVGGQPKYTIIGPPDGSDVYDSANSSITGNGPHNPFAYESATFDIGLVGVTSQSSITNVVLGFGTEAGSNVNLNPPVLPEPATLLMMLAGFSLIAARKRRRRMVI